MRRGSLIKYVSADRVDATNARSPVDVIRGIGPKGKRELESRGIFTVEEMSKVPASTRTAFSVVSSKQFQYADVVMRKIHLEKSAPRSAAARRLSKRMSNPNVLDMETYFFQPDLPQELTVGQRLGIGSFASVFAAKADSPTLRGNFAIKCFDLRRVLRKEVEKIRNDILDEARLQEQLKHERIVRLFHVVDASPVHICMILEYCGGGDLLTRIQEKGAYPEKLASIVVRNVLSALSYMHSKGICHRDLKLENVLLRSRHSDTDVKLADFGTAKILASHHHTGTFVGTKYTMAPEVMLCDSVHAGIRDDDTDGMDIDDDGPTYDGTKADVWSCGALMYTMLKASYPRNREDIRRWPVGNVDASTSNSTVISPDAKRALLHMMEIDPTKRPSSTKALEFVWVSGDQKRQRVVTPNRRAIGNLAKRAMNMRQVEQSSGVDNAMRCDDDDDNEKGCVVQ